jgi:hypothetical protein
VKPKEETMHGRQRWASALGAGVLGLAALLGPPKSAAHCDTLDGPVATDAREALASGDVTVALKWVRAEDEAAIRQAFSLARAARELGPAAREVAETFFLETLARTHRLGEGECYEGLQPAGSTPPIVAEADRSLASGSVGDLARALAETAARGIQSRFDRVLETRRQAHDGVIAGRAYVAAYGDYIHYVERLHAAVHAPRTPQDARAPAHAEAKPPTH